MKCERCGKFRASKDLTYVGHGDGNSHEEVLECYWCLTPVDQAEEHELADWLISSGWVTAPPKNEGENK